MELIIKYSNVKAQIWDHFLLKDTKVTINKFNAKLGITGSDDILKTKDTFRYELEDTFEEIEIIISTMFRHNGVEYQLLKIIQRFLVKREDNHIVELIPTRWQKLSLEQKTTIARTTPSLHPLLNVKGGMITILIDFVDITRLFNDIHGDTPWFSALNLIKGTQRHIRVMASLRGHPFIWFVVVPGSVAHIKELQPNLLIYPAGFGGINYVADKIEGITTNNHNMSVGNIQCSGETLFSFLTQPITDPDYDVYLKDYLKLQDRFKYRLGRKLPPLHHFRDLLNYDPSKEGLYPLSWDKPFGFEQAIDKQQQILLIPQINGGDGGIAIQENLMGLVKNVIYYIYTHTNTLTYETIDVKQLILTGYSNSGGNIFTATKRNLKDIKAIICFEVQYMNKHDENKQLTLGKNVIPALLAQGGKVIIVGRRKNEWESKYLPDGVSHSKLILLPDESHYSILEYPDVSKPYNPSAFPVLKRHYSRLLKNNSDNVITNILGSESGVIDFYSVKKELKVEEIIEKFRKSGFNDEQIIKIIFTPKLNNDHGGYYVHNFIISSGQELSVDGQTIYKFFHQSLDLIT
ncbi:hypothetical protein ACRC6Q_13815 [Planococcus sp. SE5232]|uniref:hypothetical protein n=1 Tax=unclassified Planococcus (in: firmicutes) TaxID=2662419 RepID=UPI003D6ADD99